MYRPVNRLVAILVVAVIVFAGFGQAVLHLWNWLMPDLFGLRPITYWQAMGLLGLCWILFRGGFLGFPYGAWERRRHLKQRWDQMTPEEREQLRKGLQCGRSASPSPAEKV